MQEKEATTHCGSPLIVGAISCILFLLVRYVHYSSWRSIWTEKKRSLVTPLFFISKDNKPSAIESANPTSRLRREGLCVFRRAPLLFLALCYSNLFGVASSTKRKMRIGVNLPLQGASLRLLDAVQTCAGLRPTNPPKASPAFGILHLPLSLGHLLCPRSLRLRQLSKADRSSQGQAYRMLSHPLTVSPVLALPAPSRPTEDKKTKFSVITLKSKRG